MDAEKPLSRKEARQAEGGKAVLELKNKVAQLDDEKTQKISELETENRNLRVKVGTMEKTLEDMQGQFVTFAEQLRNCERKKEPTLKGPAQDELQQLSVRVAEMEKQPPQQPAADSIVPNSATPSTLAQHRALEKRVTALHRRIDNSNHGCSEVQEPFGARVYRSDSFDLVGQGHMAHEMRLHRLEAQRFGDRRYIEQLHKTGEEGMKSLIKDISAMKAVSPVEQETGDTTGKSGTATVAIRENRDDSPDSDDDKTPDGDSWKAVEKNRNVRRLIEDAFLPAAPGDRPIHILPPPPRGQRPGSGFRIMRIGADGRVRNSGE